MLLPCQTKFINYIIVFWRDCVPADRTVTWLQQCSENPEFGTTLAGRLNQSRASAVLQSNLIAIKFGTAEARRLNWALPFLSEVFFLQKAIYRKVLVCPRCIPIFRQQIKTWCGKWYSFPRETIFYLSISLSLGHHPIQSFHRPCVTSQKNVSVGR